MASLDSPSDVRGSGRRHSVAELAVTHPPQQRLSHTDIARLAALPKEERHSAAPYAWTPAGKLYKDYRDAAHAKDDNGDYIITQEDQRAAVLRAPEGSKDKRTTTELKSEFSESERLSTTQLAALFTLTKAERHRLAPYAWTYKGILLKEYRDVAHAKDEDDNYIIESERDRATILRATQRRAVVESRAPAEEQASVPGLIHYPWSTNLQSKEYIKAQRAATEGNAAAPMFFGKGKQYEHHLPVKWVDPAHTVIQYMELAPGARLDEHTGDHTIRFRQDIVYPYRTKRRKGLAVMATIKAQACSLVLLLNVLNQAACGLGHGKFYFVPASSEMSRPADILYSSEICSKQRQ